MQGKRKASGKMDNELEKAKTTFRQWGCPVLYQPLLWGGENIDVSPEKSTPAAQAGHRGSDFCRWLQFSSFRSSVAMAEASSSLVLLPLLSPFHPPPSLLFFSLLSLLFRGFKFSREKAARLTIQVKHLTLKSDTDPLRS